MLLYDEEVKIMYIVDRTITAPGLEKINKIANAKEAIRR